MFTNGKYESAESLQTKHRFLHWLHVMISKRPGTVESPGGIHRRRHQKRRKAVKLLPKCCPKQKSPAFRGVFSEKQSFYLRYFVILLKGLKSRKEFFHYSSSIPESRFLVIPSPFFRFWRAQNTYSRQCCRYEPQHAGQNLSSEALHTPIQHE